MNLRAVIFDLDGTLIDSRGDIARACNEMLEALGREVLPSSVVSGFVGDGARALVVRALGEETSEELVDEGLEKFLTFYEAAPVKNTVILRGVSHALTALRGQLLLGLCTNKPRRTTLPVLAGLGWENAFDAIAAGGDTPEKKPHPAPVLAVCRALGVAPEEAVMIGDGPQDIFAGRAAGVRTIGVREGILPVERLLAAEPDVLLECLEDLLPLLKSWGTKVH